MVQYVQGPRGLTVLADGHYRLPEGLSETGADRRDACAEGVRALLREGCFQGRHVVVSLPNSIMRYKSLRMPMMPSDELSQAVGWEASDKFMAPESSLVVQHICAGEVHSGGEIRQEVILMAADLGEVNHVTEVLRCVGLKPLAFENSVTALARGFAYRGSAVGGDEGSGEGAGEWRDAESEVPVVLDIGSHGTNILILNGDRVKFCRRIPIGGKRMDEAVAEGMGVPLEEAQVMRRRSQNNAESRSGKLRGPAEPAEVEAFESKVALALEGVIKELGQEIGLCLRYYSVTFRGAFPERFVLCGGDAREPSLGEQLGWQLDKAVEVARPFEGIDLSGEGVKLERRGALPDWSVAAGVALREAPVLGRLKRGAA